MSGIHIAALFETTQAARAAEAGLVAAGVDHSRILVLDRGHRDTPSQGGLWTILKHVFLPDSDAHQYAEGIVRGHPLLVADVTDAEQGAALAALQAANPIDIENRTQSWRDDGWSGEYADAPDGIAGGRAFDGAENSEGDLRRADVITGDYGSVGAPLGGHLNLDILRGKTIGGGSRTAERTGDGDDVRVYTVN